MNKSRLFLASILIALAPVITADTIELSNGKKIEGTFSGRDGDTIKFNVDGIDMTFQSKDVKNIAIGASAKPTTVAKNTVSTEKVVAGSAVIPAGTKMTVRLKETLDSGRHAKGHKFSGVLEGALVSNGVTVVSAGSKVYGVVSDAVKARRIAGDAKILITITDINIKGQIIPVSTSAINALTESTGRSTVGTVGKGAAIGALASGSSGARDGAKIGLGLAILKGGNQVVVPAGTLLDFKLAKSLSSQ